MENAAPILHHYDKVTGEYVSTSQANLSPLDEEIRQDRIAHNQLVDDLQANADAMPKKKGKECIIPEKVDVPDPVYLIPADATAIIPTEEKEGFARVFARGEWNYIEDHRGRTFYDQNRIPVIVQALGSIPEELTETPRAQTRDELLAAIRQQRNNLLSMSDWAVLPDSPLSVDQKDAWYVYRTALRNITDQADLANIQWPDYPA